GAFLKLRHAEFSELRGFSFDKLAATLMDEVSVLYSLLINVVSPRVDPTVTQRRKRAAVCSALSMLLRQRSQRSSGLAMLTSLFLVGTNCNSLAFAFLHGLGLCLSEKQVNNIRRAYVDSCRAELKALATPLANLRRVQLVIDNINIHRLGAGGKGTMHNFTVGTLNAATLLPLGHDWDALKHFAKMSVARVLVTHISVFKPFARQVQRMVAASHLGPEATARNTAGFPEHLSRTPPAPIDAAQSVFSLGAFNFDESTHDGMSNILSEIIQLLGLPQVDKTVKIHLNGDQLTYDRVRGAQLLQSEHPTAQNIRDLLCVIDKFGDFHGQWAFLKILMGLHHGKVDSEFGSYWHFMAATGKRKRTNDHEARVYYRAESTVCDSEDAYIMGFALSDLRVHLSQPEMLASRPDRPPSARMRAEQYDARDKLNEQALMVFIHNYIKDGIRRADSFPIIRGYKFMLPYLAGATSVHYPIEMVRALLKLLCDLSPGDGYVEFHNRCMPSRTGRASHNIAMDMYMEHMIREIKRAIGSNSPNFGFALVNDTTWLVNLLREVTANLADSLVLARNPVGHKEAEKGALLGHYAGLLLENGVYGISPPLTPSPPAVLSAGLDKLQGKWFKDIVRSIPRVYYHATQAAMGERKDDAPPDSDEETGGVEGGEGGERGEGVEEQAVIAINFNEKDQLRDDEDENDEDED
ncbi:hypothetical protein B484DRAFT_433626, partial [Ochromonadaceae sp. CCMP2298]